MYKKGWDIFFYPSFFGYIYSIQIKTNYIMTGKYKIFANGDSCIIYVNDNYVWLMKNWYSNGGERYDVDTTDINQAIDLTIEEWMEENEVDDHILL